MICVAKTKVLSAMQLLHSGAVSLFSHRQKSGFLMMQMIYK